MLYVHQALRVARCCRCPDDRHAGEAGNGVLEYLESLAAQVRPKVGKARNIATWPGKTSDKARANRIGILRHDNRYRGSRFLGVMRGRRALSDDHAYPQTDQFVCKRAETVGLSFRKSILDGNILPNNVSQVAQAPLEGVSAGYHRGARVDAQKSNRDFIGCLLRARRERPRHRRTAEKRDERAALHVWMAPALQEIIWRAAQRSLAVMCPACWCSPGGLLALMGSANRVLIIRTGSMSR